MKRNKIYFFSQWRLLQKDSTLSNQSSIFMRLLIMNRPEWVTIVIGCMAAILSGATQILFAVLLAAIVDVNHSIMNIKFK